MADLVSSQVLQKTLDELRNITRIDLCVTNTDGVLLVTTFPETAIDAESIRSFVLSAADSQIVQEYHYFKVYDNQNVEYILISKGSSDDAYMIGKVAVCEIQNLIIAYKERLDKTTLSRTFFSTIFFWWMSTTARKSFASTQMCAALFTW